MTVSDQLSQLRTLRTTLVFQPFLVISLSLAVLQHPKHLGDELWDIHEQLAIAYLDIGDFDHAKTYIDILIEKFSDSSFRIKKLFAREAEAKCEFNKAMALYTQLIAERESDLTLYKRKISILKSQGQTQRAIRTLVTLLETMPQDFEGWLELSNLYVSENMFQQALYAAEEACLLLPNNHLIHESIAQLYTALGMPELALKSYCRCVELVPCYVPGLFGIVQCVDDLGSSDASKRELRNRLKTTAADSLLFLYAQIIVPNVDDSATLQAIREFLISDRI